jgi:hypothetical protein
VRKSYVNDISFVKDEFLSNFSIQKEDSQEVWELLGKMSPRNSLFATS